MRGFLSKMLVIIVVAGVLMTAGIFVRGVVSDRIANRNQASRSIAESLADSQTIAGLALVVDYTEHYTTPILRNDGSVMREEQNAIPGQTIILPETARLTGTLNNDTRYRGIFHVNTYLLSGKLASTLKMPNLEDLPRSKAGSTITVEHARLILTVSDPRGLRKLDLKLGDQTLRMDSGTGIKADGNGAHAEIPNPAQKLGQTLNAVLDLQLAGTDDFSMVPLARETYANLTSKWPHPSFNGRFLPVARQVNASGFEAEWNINALASNARQTWRGTQSGQISSAVDSFGVTMIDPVDIYSMSDRASKYAELFITLTLGAFLLFELLRNLQLHPMNYLLIGAALLIFFVMLLSLSEHIGFGPAYLAAASACVLLIGFYSANLLRSPWLAAGFTLGLGSLYGALYVILLSEQNALLMGSLLLFGLLACVMVGTRKVDWHTLLAVRAQTPSDQ